MSKQAIYLKNSLESWGQDNFIAIYKDELAQLGVESLPLQQGMSQGSVASDEQLALIVLSSNEDEQFIYIKTAFMYTSILAGCQCADDPNPVDEQAEYCEAMVTIDKQSAVTKISLTESD